MKCVSTNISKIIGAWRFNEENFKRLSGGFFKFEYSNNTTFGLFSVITYQQLVTEKKHKDRDCKRFIAFFMFFQFCCRRY